MVNPDSSPLPWERPTCPHCGGGGNWCVVTFDLNAIDFSCFFCGWAYSEKVSLGHFISPRGPVKLPPHLSSGLVKNSSKRHLQLPTDVV